MIDSTRRRLVKLGGAGAMLTVFAPGTAMAKGRQREGASAEQTIFEIAKIEGFEILVAALEETGLDAVLDSDGRQLTVFAPTDAAFEALLEALEIDAEKLLDRPYLENILLYHVTKGRRYTASIDQAPGIQMLNRDTVRVDGTSLNDNQANIIDTDIEASNGVIHVIDGVLLPD